MIAALRELAARALGFLRGRRPDSDLEAEFADHIAMAAEDFERAGMSPQEARRRATLQFGSPLSARESVGDQRSMPWLESFFHDAAYALRGMRKSPAFTSVAVLTLALGIGANTAIFSLVDAVLLRQLPVRDPHSLYYLWVAGAKGPNGGPPYEVYESFRDHTTSFQEMAAHVAINFPVNIGNHLEQVWGESVSSSYFQLLGVNSAAGRVLVPSDDRLQPPVAVLGYAYWQSHFGGDPAALGKTITIDQKQFTIVGVVEPRFTGLAPGQSAGVYVPFTSGDPKDRKGLVFYADIVARLRPGVSPQRARNEIDPLYQNFLKPFVDLSPEMRRDYLDHMVLLPAGRGAETLRAQFTEPLLILMVLVGVVLLVGCSNLANLFMARAASRQKEFAVRLAIGAGWWRLARQLLTETMLLFACGAVLGFALASWGSRLLAGFLAVGRLPMYIDPHLNTSVLVFTASVTLLAGLMFGVMPTLASARVDPQAALHGAGGRTTDSRVRNAVRHCLVAAQVALSLAVLVGGGLFVRTLANLNSLDLGFRQQGVLTMRVSPAGPGYNDARLDGLWSGLLAQVERTPGVTVASLSDITPLSDRDRGIRITVPGSQPANPLDQLIHQNQVSVSYFETFGIPLTAGRPFTAADGKNAPPVAILNEAAAKFYFPGSNPVGATIAMGTNGLRTVVGVVSNARHMNLRQEVPRSVYIPMAQHQFRLGQTTLAIRTSGNPARLAAAIEHQVRSGRPDVLVTEVLTLQQQVDASLVQERLLSAIGGFFSLLALLLSAVGLYGLLAHVVGQRTSEIGIRIALGAEPGAVVWMILRRSLWLVVIGLAAGIPAALWAARPLASLLYGLQPTDPATIAAGVLVLVATALVASYLPARRAARIDPLTALRSE